MTNDNSKTLPNYTPPREKSAGFWARVFKTRDPGYWKETLQKELDIRWGTFDSNLENLSKEWKGFKKTQMEITEAYDNAQSCEKGWSEALTSLGNLINKKTSHEKGMWAVTQSSRQSRNMKIKQKFIRAGVDEMNFNNMMDYIKQYPELQSSDIIEKAVSAVNDKRKEVSEAEKTYNQKMREANTYLNTAQSELRKIKKELDSFETFKDEGKAKIMAEQNKLTFKLKSTLMTAAEKEGLKLFIFEYDRKIGESRDQLKLMEDDLDNYQERKFVPIVTQKFKAVED